MPTTDLTQAEMSLAAERLLDERFDQLTATPYLAHLVEPLRDLQRAFVDDERDPRAELRAAIAEVQAHTTRFDDVVRALDHFLHGFRLLAGDAARGPIEAAHGELLPDGRQLITRSVGDKAAEARLMTGRIDPPVAETLDGLRVGDQSLLDLVQRDLYAASEAIGDAQAERLEIEASTAHRTRGFNLATRRRFVQLDSTLRALLDIHGADEGLRADLLGFTDRMVAQAERRAAGRRGIADRAGAAEAVEAPPAEAAPGAPADAAPVDARPDAADDPSQPLQPLRF